MFMQDERAVSDVVSKALMIGLVVVAVAVIGAFVGGIMDFKRAPMAQFRIIDDPRPISDATVDEGVIIIRHLGGDGIPYNEIVLAVYDARGYNLFQETLSDNPTTGAGYNVSDRTSPATEFNGGDQLFLGNGTIGGNNAGTYEVVLYSKPTMQPILSKKITVS